ncbi:MAG: hypothetical protein AAB575_04135 [Patescibacteria group bacterium]
MYLEPKFPVISLVVSKIEEYFEQLRMKHDRGTILKPEAMAIQYAVCAFLRVLQEAELGESKPMVLETLRGFKHSRFESFDFHKRLLEVIDYLEREYSGTKEGEGMREEKFQEVDDLLKGLENAIKELKDSCDNGMEKKEGRPPFIVLEGIFSSLIYVLLRSDLGEYKKMVLERLHSFEDQRFKDADFYKKLIEAIDCLEDNEKLRKELSLG